MSGVGVESEGQVSPFPVFYLNAVGYGDLAVLLGLLSPEYFRHGDGFEFEADPSTLLEGGLQMAGAVGHF